MFYQTVYCQFLYRELLRMSQLIRGINFPTWYDNFFQQSWEVLTSQLDGGFLDCIVGQSTSCIHYLVNTSLPIHCRISFRVIIYIWDANLQVQIFVYVYYLPNKHKMHHEYKQYTGHLVNGLLSHSSNHRLPHLFCWWLVPFI